MAIVTGSVMGSFRGRLGDAVSYQLNGKNVVRSLPEKSAKNKRGTELQNVYRSRFTKMQQFLQPILLFIRIGYNMEGRSRQMSAHNAAKSYNMLNAFNAEGEIDYSKVLVSFGNLPSALNAIVQKDDIGLHFSWSDNSGEGRAKSRDQVMLIAYDDMVLDSHNHKNPKAYMILSGARRKTQMETLEIGPISKGHRLHTYIAFISDDRESISTSIYVGEIEY